MNDLKEYKEHIDKLFADLNVNEKRKIALMSMERQFKAYCQLAENVDWNRQSEYRTLLDECWSAVLNDSPLGEEVWEKHSGIKPSTVNSVRGEYTKIPFAYTNIFADNFEAFLEMLLDDTGGEESFLLFNIDFLLKYSKENNYSTETKDRLLLRELNNQHNDTDFQRSVTKLTDVINWCNQTDNLIFP